ncbi:Wings apart [Hyphodiscus hymeniophilus]|uniref:Wings apart n=1 Tax=Hyphodiscus hymeniophilus TaxID=353542 RepID=A0A9P6VIQ1_9HELO|nr:Wings apart [Hyphodiscus hymeniophilus]
MATLQNAAPPRKRVATYGKAARRRIPDFAFTSLPHRSQTPEVKPSEMLRSRSTGLASVPEPKKTKATMMASVSRTASPDSSPVAADIFDVPSSNDDEPTPRPAHKAVKTQNRLSKVEKDTLVVRKERVEMRKRAKLSPVRHAQKLSPVKSVTKALSPKAKPQSMVKPTTFVARPKPVHKKPAQPRTPRKLSPVQKALPTATTSPQATHVDNMDVDPPTGGSYISPRGMQMWSDLLEPADGDGIVEDTMAMKHQAQVQTSPARIVGKTLFKSAGVIKQRNPRTLPRRRLIDSLVGQATLDDDVLEEDTSESDQSDLIEASAPISNPISRNQSAAPDDPVMLTSESQSQGSQVIGPKFTYSKQRSMLAEENFMKQLELDMSQPIQPTLGKKPRRGSVPVLPKLQSFNEDEEEDSAVAIKSVHELRQAGANNRFMDEIEDLLDRIGSPTVTPSSMRRSGLLDIASKIKDKSFTRQFRSQGVELRLFVHMGRETDVIAGFTMISILLVLLSESNILPHVVTLLRTQGIARLLIRLLESQTSITMLAKDRKSNMSKVAQSLLSEHSEYLLSLPVWGEAQPRMQPKTLSPRTVALKCLELMVRQTREAGNSGDLISKELTTKLFSIMKLASDESAWELPSGKEAVDFGLALSAIESHSLAARTLSDEKIWLDDYLQIIADTLETALTQPIDKFGDFQYLLLRLTLNVTGNNEKASKVFARDSLMAVMAQVIVAMFSKISHFLTEEDLFAAVENLIVLEGVMINFAESSSAARNSFQSLQGTPHDSLDTMVKHLVDNQEKISLAESLEDNHKNIPFGYLSVLLGYLCLSPTILERVRNQLEGKTLKPLLASIEEFIGHHKTVDDLYATEDGHSPNSAFTERLEALVSILKAPKANGK